MRSPFLGMDPFIEASGRWEGFHTRLIAEMDRALAALLPERYAVDIGERCYIDYIDPQQGLAQREIVPDLKIRSTPPWSSAAQSQTAVAEETPAGYAMHGLVEVEMREVFLEIRELDPHSRLVTCVEVLSPSNKRPGTAGWHLYQRKRQVFLQGHANLVEIDLLRGGQRMPMVEAWQQHPYHIAVLRRESAPRFEVLPAHFHVALPPVPIPLSSPDADVSLPLQPLVDAIYARSKYDRSFDYRQLIYPPLASADAAWLEERLASQSDA